jgi:hypothetical protein
MGIQTPPKKTPLEIERVVIHLAPFQSLEGRQKLNKYLN